MAVVLTGVGGVKTFIADVPIDVVSRRAFSSTSNVTNHPIEDGSSADDHIIDLPDELQIDGEITNTPLGPLNALGRTATWAEDEFQKLRDAKAAKLPVTVLSGPYAYEVYKDEGMIIKGLTRTDDRNSGESVSFSISLRKINKVESATVAAASRGDDVQSEQQSTGTQVKTPA